MAGGYDGTIRINTQLDNKGFSRGVSEIRSSLNSVVGSIKGLTTALGVGLSLAGLVKVGKQAIDLASDLQEVQNVVDTAFKSMSYKMEEFAKTSIEQFGLSKLAAKQMGSTFMAMASNMVPSMEKASDMAISLTGRAADMASFYNKTASETATALNSIFTGETETLKQYGVVMTEANLQQYAYQQGIKKTLSDMSQAEKVQLRYNYVMEQTSLAAGDFAKTSDSWANQTRILSEQFKELLSILGSGLIQVLTPVVQGLNTVLSKLIEVANAIGTIMSKLLGLNSVKLSSSGQSAADGFAAATDNVKGYTDAVNKADKANKGSVASFDDLTMLQSKSASGSGADLSFGATGMQDFTTEAVKGEEAVDELSNVFLDFISAISPVTDALKALWDEGLSLLAGFSCQALIDFYNEFLVPLGKWAFGTENKGFTRLINIINDDLKRIDWNGISKNLKDFWKAIEPYAENFGEGIIDFFEKLGDVSVDVINIMFGSNGIFSFLIDALENGNPESARLWGYGLAELAVGLIALNAALKGYAVVAGIVATLKEFATWIPILWQSLQFNPGMIGQLGLTIEKLLQGTILDTNTWAGLPKQIDDAISKAFDEIEQAITEGFIGLIEGTFNWNETIDLFAQAEQFFISVGEAFSNHDWAGVGLNILMGILYGFAGAIAFILEPIQDLFVTIFNAICSIFGIHSPAATMMPLGQYIMLGIVQGFKDKIAEFKKIMTDWYENTVKPWFSLEFWINALAGMRQGFSDTLNGLKEDIKIPINAIIGTFEGFVNGIISAINSLINGLNSLTFEFPDWIPGDLGGKSFGLNIPNINQLSIPRLATGTVVPPGMSQFMAILGDNNKETEVVSPLSTMKEALMEAMVEMGGTGQSGDIIINIDGREVFRVVREQNKEYKKTTGKSAFA